VGPPTRKKQTGDGSTHLVAVYLGPRTGPVPPPRRTRPRGRNATPHRDHTSPAFDDLYDRDVIGAMRDYALVRAIEYLYEQYQVTQTSRSTGARSVSGD
jgi:hypothetical protein